MCYKIDTFQWNINKDNSKLNITESLVQYTQSYRHTLIMKYFSSSMESHFL